MSKKALITGITGQDGAYLARLLVDKGYQVYGAYRRASTPNFWRLDALDVTDDVNLVCMEMTDYASILDQVDKIQPDEIYNLAAQSFVGASFKQPIYTGDVNGLSVTRLLDAIRVVNPKIRFYQASTSEMFGKAQQVPQTEITPFHPRSPYGVAKLYGHWIAINYREAYGIHACSGILFNHESRLRGAEFVTKKITAAFAAQSLGKAGPVALGNLDAKRDWGYAGDYVHGMWLMMQHDTPDDYVLATGKTASIREFAEYAAQAIGFQLVWKGKGLDEIGVDARTGEVWVRIDPDFYRPAEVDLLIGDPSKAEKHLGWRRSMDLQDLVEDMVGGDLQSLQDQTYPEKRRVFV